MKTVICAVIVALCLAARASALDCYVCTDCSLSGVFSIFESKTTCTSSVLNILGTGEPRCVKDVEGDGKVNRRCGVASECAITSTFAKCQNPDDTACSICCETDACNSALTMKAAWIAVALALAVAVLAPRF